MKCQHAIYFWPFLWGSFFCFQGPLVAKKKDLMAYFCLADLFYFLTLYLLL